MFKSSIEEISEELICITKPQREQGEWLNFSQAIKLWKDSVLKDKMEKRVKNHDSHTDLKMNTF